MLVNVILGGLASFLVPEGPDGGIDFSKGGVEKKVWFVGSFVLLEF
jgi:hypothetical protein